MKLRQQYTRIGFRAVADTPDWADKWWMSVNKYKTMSPDDVKSEWLTKEQAQQLGTVPMPPRKDKELKDLLKSLKPDPPNPYAAQMQGLREQIEGIHEMLNGLQQSLNELTGAQSSSLTSRFGPRFDDLLQHLPNENEGSKLTNEKKLAVRRLIDEGASLRGINALHLAAAAYKERNLFDLLIEDYGMDVEAFDDIGRRPIHVAACCSNPDAVRILLSKGADKNGRNKEGQTAFEEAGQVQRNMGFRTS